MLKKIVRIAGLVALIVSGAAPGAYAQEAVLIGTVTDPTGGVVPGVTVTAINETTGNLFEGVTDDRGIYRIPVRVGTYTVTAQLSGFTTVTRTGVELLVGQTLGVNLQISPSAVQESVTVTGEAPLIETTTSSLGGNIDPRQIQGIPTYGRNWVALAMLAPGSRWGKDLNTQTPLPDRNNNEAREFQLNIDGQQVSADIGTGGQPKYSADSIAEFQFISNRFDATMGRSSGIQVNVITRSGSNQIDGLFRSNFRNSRLNAENPVLNRIEPINNQQYSTAVGGPILQNKLHYFANFEYEREPKTLIFNTPYPAFNVDVRGTDNQKKGGVRLDYQLSPRSRLMGKYSRAAIWQPNLNNNLQSHPAATGTNREYNYEALGQLTNVLSNSALNELKVGEAVFGLANRNLTTWSKHWQAINGINTGSPRITFTGFSIAGNQNYPRHQDQWVWNVRDDFTYSYDAMGRHDLRAGAEFLHRHQIQANCRQCMGTVAATGGTRPANLEALFPDPFNADTWNLAAISGITTSYSIGVGDFNVHLYSKKFASWAQDDWQLTDKLTLNLGLRYDLEIGVFANDISLPPFQEAGRPNDTKNIQPRVGFAYKLNDQTVVRGGSGIYYGDALGADQSFATGNVQIAVVRYDNTPARADFTANPTNSQPLPTYDQAVTRFCYANNNAPGCLIRDLQEFVGPPQYVHLPRTLQSSIGMQRQFGGTMAVEADYVYSKGTHEKDVVDNINLRFDPVTGANLDFRVRANRPYPDWGVVSMNAHLGRSEYHGLQTGFTKRMSNRWQASATYTLSWLYNADTKPFSGLEQVTFATVPDMGGEWGLSQDDQRHRAVFSGIWEVGGGFRISALHYLAAGIRLPHNYGGDQRNSGGGNIFSGRLRPDGSIVPRNDLIRPPQNRTSIGLQQRVPMSGGVSLDLIADVFNVFNRPNWDIGTQESNAVQFRQHISAEVRTMQVGFRVTF